MVVFKLNVLGRNIQNKSTGKTLDGIELEDMEIKVKSGLVEEYYQEYEKGILNFFNSDTNLRLVVHDK